MTAVIDETGRKYGDRIVLRRGDRKSSSGDVFWRVRCLRCGDEREILGRQLRIGKGNTCMLCSVTKHGQCYTPEYRAWADMKQRCLNPAEPSYKRYGARGISVCESWINSFEQFLFDMGERPSAEHTLERKNNNGNYEKENCIWAVKIVQANNTRRNVSVSFRGVTKTLSMWARDVGINYRTLNNRINRGWSVERALTAPVQVRLFGGGGE